uniref:Uncharacterized protein n=1 Tax=Streptomyces sp. FR1 TaxID=349971 RepID=I1VH22_9ACTN|nr:hypothetical protein [Streptomyces sp. FR1]AFI44020.1 hypothetical protein pFP4.21c [Streptomyces sp. FR1]
MITHQPSPEQLERLQQAQLGASQTEVAVAEARAKLAQAIAEHSEATTTLNRAIHDVLYGPQDGSPRRLKSAYEASNQMARDHWPTPGGTPGG